MQVPHELDEPEKPEKVAAAHRRTAKILNGGLHSGNPVHPDGFANGQIDNEDISWVRTTIAAASFYVQGAAAGAAVTFTHNLNSSINGLTALGAFVLVNVTWRIRMVRSTAKCGPVGLMFLAGDTITADSIQLRPTCSHVPADSVTVAVAFQTCSPT